MIQNIIYKIQNFFSPPQKWIKKYIEYNSYDDFYMILADFMFGWVVEIVEIHKHFEIYEFDFYDCPDHQLEDAIVNDEHLNNLFEMTEENINQEKQKIIKRRTCKREILECVRYAHIRDKIKRHIEITDAMNSYKWEMKLIQMDKRYMHIIVKHHEMINP